MEKILGLTQEEARQQLLKFGLNEVKDKHRVTPLQILFRQVQKNFVLYLLTVTAVVSLFLGKSETASVISVVILLVIVTGFIQEYKAENAIQALRQMIMPVSRVIRNGREQEISSKELVPDDIVVLRAGEKVPADCALIDQTNLQVNESVLTGESKEVRKVVPTTQEYTDDNMVFMGSFIVSGKGMGKVIHTGMNTKFGNIAGMIATTEKKYPLQDKINNISKYMVIVGLSASVITGILLFTRAEAITAEILVEILIIVVALSVSSFPEGFPVVLTITLAAGVNRMAKQNAIVNRMSVIETLGETTVICSDKTGTLTKGEMTVQSLWINNKFLSVSGVGYEGLGTITYDGIPVNVQEDKPLSLFLKTAVICNDATITRTGEDDLYHVLGSTTEGSLLILGAKTGMFKENLPLKRTNEIPFDSERKMMSVTYNENDQLVLYAKGAPEILLAKCSNILKGNDVVPLTDQEKEKILQANHQLTEKALRTLALAYKPSPESTDSEEHLTFLGIVGMEDPPREEVKEAIQTCTHAGIKVKMITGDNKITARAIADQIGLSGEIIEGTYLDSVTDEELQRLVMTTTIFARVRPEHKLRIVKALKENNEIVAMTGDGVNDAPALKDAHIGIAMGRNGTDVSRSVADITLKDDNFSTIVAAIKEGRMVFNNIRKFVTYQLSCNLAEIIIILSGVLLAPFLGWYVPIITALQILFMNLVTDNLPAITLGFNPSSNDIMREKPRRKAEILTGEFIRLIIFNAVVMAFIASSALFLTFNILGVESKLAQTTALVTMIVLDIISAFNFRSFRFRVLNRGFFVNKYLAIASIISIAATLLILYTPLSIMFEVTPLGIEQWLIAIAAGILIIVIFDILKTINNKTHTLLQHTT